MPRYEPLRAFCDIDIAIMHQRMKTVVDQFPSGWQAMIAWELRLLQNMAAMEEAFFFYGYCRSSPALVPLDLVPLDARPRKHLHTSRP